MANTLQYYRLRSIFLKCSYKKYLWFSQLILLVSNETVSLLNRDQFYFFLANNFNWCILNEIFFDLNKKGINIIPTIFCWVEALMQLIAKLFQLISSMEFASVYIYLYTIQCNVCWYFDKSRKLFCFMETLK